MKAPANCEAAPVCAGLVSLDSRGFRQEPIVSPGAVSRSVRCHWASVECDMEKIDACIDKVATLVGYLCWCLLQWAARVFDRILAVLAFI